MLKKFLMILSLVCLAGCDDRIHVNNTITKGIVSDKIYVAPQSVGVQSITCSDDSNLYAVSQTKELYLIVLENAILDPRCNCTVKTRSVYAVSPSFFSEIQTGNELDVEGNPNIKPAMIATCVPQNRKTN